jgi:hypothetical protein
LTLPPAPPHNARMTGMFLSARITRPAQA